MKSQFSPAIPLNRVTVASAPECCAVYKLLDTGGYVLYVGWAKEGQLRNRLLEHVTKREVPGVVNYVYQQFSSELAAEESAAKLIQATRPKINLMAR